MVTDKFVDNNIGPLYQHDLIAISVCIINNIQYVILDVITHTCIISSVAFNTMRPRQSGRHFADDIFKRIFFNENVWISIKISLKFVPKGPINKIPALFQMMAWRRPGDKPLSEAMLVSLLTHKCASRPQWVNKIDKGYGWVITSLTKQWMWLLSMTQSELIFVSKDGLYMYATIDMQPTKWERSGNQVIVPACRNCSLDEIYP